MAYFLHRRYPVIKLDENWNCHAQAEKRNTLNIWFFYTVSVHVAPRFQRNVWDKYLDKYRYHSRTLSFSSLKIITFSTKVFVVNLGINDHCGQVDRLSTVSPSRRQHKMVLLKEEYLPKAKVKSKRSDLLIVRPRAWPALLLKCKLITCRNQSENVTCKQIST